MSDSSQGSGWWQASDGKWYPPETHPDYQPPGTLAPPSSEPTLPQQAAAAPTQPAVEYATPGPIASPDDKKPWYRRWWAITLGVLLVLGVIGAIVSPPEDDDDAAVETTEVPEVVDTTVAPSTTVEVTTATTVAATPVPTTTPATTPPTTAAPTTPPTTAARTTPPTTAAPTTPPTTEFVLTEDDVRTLVFPIVFDSSRDEVLEILNGNFVVETVDRYVYDADTGTVLLDITPAFDFDDGVRDDAWEIMRGMSELWTVNAWVETDRDWSPALDVSISTAQYRCTGDQMRQMQDARFGRPDWEATCRVR